MFKYIYPDRELFESRLEEVGFHQPTIQVYASGVVNPKSGSHQTAKNTWKKIMDGIPVPSPVQKVRANGRRGIQNQRIGLEYNKPNLLKLETPKPQPEPTVEKEKVVETTQDPKISAIKTILALEGISDAVKVQMISLLFA